MRRGYTTISIFMILLLSVSSPTWAAAYYNRDELPAGQNPDYTIKYDQSRYNPKNNKEDRQKLIAQHSDQILTAAGCTETTTYETYDPNTGGYVKRTVAAVESCKIRVDQFKTLYTPESKSNTASPPPPQPRETRTICTNKVSYRPGKVLNAQYQLLRQNSVFVDREAQFRLVAEVEYNIWVDQECYEEERYGNGTWSRSGSARTTSGVFAKVVYDPTGFGYDEFNVRPADPKTKVRQIDSKTFAVQWHEVGERGTTEHIQGSIILKDKNKFKKLDEIAASSDWKGHTRADIWNVTYEEPPQMVYDIDEGVEVVYKLSNGTELNKIMVEGVASTNR